MKFNSRKLARILLQIIVMIAIFALLFWYVGASSSAQNSSFIDILLSLNPFYLLLAFLCYFGINLLFTVRLMRVLSKEGIKTSFGKTLLAHYAGMLTSDVTPGRSGYILTPLYLRDQNVSTSKSLSGILGIQTIEFLIKVVGGIGAAIYLLKAVTADKWATFGTILGINTGFLFIAIGIGLMLTGGIVLAAFSWSPRAISIFNKIANWRFLKRFTSGLLGKLEEYKEGSQQTRKAIPEITGITMLCWILKGLEWYFLGLALGITQIPWIAYFLIHPLVTALAFVPITPAGAGVQEFGIVGIFALLFTNPNIGAIAAFALLARGLLIIEDLAGVPQIVKSTSGLAFSRKKNENNPLSNPPEKK